MKIQYLIPVIAIMLIVSTSGCIEGLDFPGFLGSWGSSQPAVEQTPDIIITQDMSIIPKPPLTTGDEFLLLFTLKNQDESQPIEDVNVKLYNWGVCEPDRAQFFPNAELWQTDEELEPDLDDNTNADYYIRTFTDIGPRVEESIEWTFDTPSKERIVGIEADCPIKWEVDYTFSAVSQDDYYVISKERKRELDTTNQVWEGIDQPQYVGIGPIKIYYDFETRMPIKTNSTIQFSLQVFDKGVGLYSKIDKETMFIKIPQDWISNAVVDGTLEDVNESCTRKFNLTILTAVTGLTVGTDYITLADGTNVRLEDGHVIYKNIEVINLYKRETSKIICRFIAPDLDSTGTPEKSYLFSTNITGYKYRLPDEQTIHIIPSV